MNGGAKNTEVTYLYRDPSNWKFWGTFVVDGALGRDELKQYLLKYPWLPSDIEWFNPRMVGLEHLLTEPWDVEDHAMHELHEFVPTDRGETLCSASELIERFASASHRKWENGDKWPCL